MLVEVEMVKASVCDKGVLLFSNREHAHVVIDLPKIL